MEEMVGGLYRVPVKALEEFVTESLAISGIRKEHNDLYKEIFTRYYEVTSYQLGISKLSLPEIIHDGLLSGIIRDKRNFRTGIPALEHGFMPRAEYIKTLLEKWYVHAEQALCVLQAEGEAKRIARTDELYFELLCISPFIEANGRTARLIHNCLRIRVGLPWHVTHYRDYKNEVKRFRTYRRNVFIPAHKVCL